MDYSVVIATYNYGRFLGAAIDSALAQTVPAREIIVVDDGSTDDTARVLQQYASRVTIMRQANQGQAAAWNSALEHARGEWVAFLDADDWWVPTRVERCLTEVPDEVGVIMNDLAVVGPLVQHDSWVRWTAVRVRDGAIGDHTVPNGLPWSFTPTSGVLVRRSVLASIFPLDTRRWRTCADAPLLHRAALRTEFRFIDEPLGYYRVHGDNSYHQQGWYDGNDKPHIILENLWLTQRLAFEVNRDLASAGRSDSVALWNNTYYSKMIGWVAGRRGWWNVVLMVSRQHRGRTPGRWPLRSIAGTTLELYRYQRQRDRTLGAQLRELAREKFPDLDLKRVWTPDIGPV